MKFWFSFKTVVLTLFLSISISANSETLPLEDFVNHGDYLDLKISPTGKYLAARVRRNNTVVLVFVERETGKITGGVDPGNKNEVHTVTWVNDERVVYEFAQKHHYYDAPISTGELFSVNADGSKSKLIYGYRADDSRIGSHISTKEDSNASQEVLSILEGDDKRILIIEYPWETEGNSWYNRKSRGAVLSKLNIFTGGKRKIETIPYNNVSALADKKGNVNFIRWEESDNTFKAAYREKNKAPWMPLSAALNLDDSFNPVEIASDSSSVYLIGNIGDRQIRSMYSYNFESQKLETLFSEHDSDLSYWFNDIKTNQPVVGVSYPDKHAYHYTKTQSTISDIHRKLAKAFKGQSVALTSKTRNGELLLVRVNSDINPGEYYIYNTRSNKADFLWANRSWIDPRKMQAKEPFAIDTKDGVKLRGYLTMPDHSKEEKAPLVVTIHGGPHGVRDYWEYDDEVQLLANRGYAVLQVNYRGSGGYGLVFEEMGYRQWGGKMIEDIVEATQWAGARSDIDASRICVYGASYGGYAAMMASVRAPELFRCAVGYVGIYDLELMYSKGDIPKNWGGEEYLERVIGTDKDQLKEYSPINHIDKIKASVMLVHGDEDIRVPSAHAKRMRKKLKDAGKDVKWLLYKRSGHGVFDAESKKELYGDMLDFLSQHIGDPITK